MRIVSLSVGLPREVEWHGRTVLTSIFKAPVDCRLRVTTLNFEGDEQSDLSVHGGADKAVYAYPSEHYELWRRELPQADLPWGVFGENLTTEGLLEADIRIGDRFRAGSAEFVATQPRMPCYKLGIRFGRPDIVKRFLQSGRTGFYFALTLEGEVGAGDSIERIPQAALGSRRLSITSWPHACQGTRASAWRSRRRWFRGRSDPRQAGGTPTSSGRACMARPRLPGRSGRSSPTRSTPAAGACGSTRATPGTAADCYRN